MRKPKPQYAFARQFAAMACPVPAPECPLPGPVIELIERHDGEARSVKVLTVAEARELHGAIGAALAALDAGAAWDCENARAASVGEKS